MDIIKVKRKGSLCAICRKKINGKYHVVSWRKCHISCYYEVLTRDIDNRYEELKGLTERYRSLRESSKKSTKATIKKMKKDRTKLNRYKQYMALERL